MENNLVSTTDIAKKYNITSAAIEYWRKKGLKYTKNGRDYFYDIKDVDEFYKEKVAPRSMMAENKRNVLKQHKIENGIYCHICKENSLETSNSMFVQRHLHKFHNIQAEEYYKKFLMKEGETIDCIKCNKPKTFLSISRGYIKLCSDPACCQTFEEVTLKKKSTTKNHHGDENFRNVNKMQQTMLNRYGDKHALNVTQFKEKSKQTLINNYGVENATFSLVLRLKKEETCLRKYGVPRYTNPEKISASRVNKYIKRIKEKFLTTQYEFLEYKDYNITCKCDKGHIFTIDTKTAYSRLIVDSPLCIECVPIEQSSSTGEIEIFNFIKENYNGTVISGDRSNRYEIDIYLPDLKIGFEYNGIYWHSSLRKHKNYHRDKTNIIKNNGINLFHIFEDEWILKKEIVKSKILNLLNKTKNKIFAKKCEIRLVTDVKTQEDFYIINHIQGYSKAKCSIGLYYNEELVSLMSFDRSKFNKNYEWDLVRYTTKLHTNVIGGASKLFKHFIKTYNPSTIVSYADILTSNGLLYKTLGFKHINNSNPSYFYVHNITKERKHRFHFRKANLIKMGYDKNKTEDEIMEDLPYFKIWNGGLMTFLWDKNDLQN